MRNNGINAEIYPDVAKLKKPMGYADKKGIPYVILVGSDEMESGSLTLKEMSSGNQLKLTIDEIVDHIKK